MPWRHAVPDFDSDGFNGPVPRSLPADQQRPRVQRERRSALRYSMPYGRMGLDLARLEADRPHEHVSVSERPLLSIILMILPGFFGGVV